MKIFEGPTLERADDRFEYGEVRVYAIGIVSGVEITVIFADVSRTERRIISAWKAERHEREAYWENFS
ncbi:MAG: BrnT family toxin [Bryobacteraceae bacterium]